MRILTITCNPAVDTTYLLGRLSSGEVNRVERVLSAPGGKGNNVARVLARLGQKPVATGFTAGHTGAFVVDGLRSAGVEPAFVTIAGETRTCFTIVEQESGRTTEVREPGPTISRNDVERLTAQVRQLLTGVGAVVISGSLPPGAPADLYTRLIRETKAAGVFVALDSSGDALRAGVDAGPDLIKPNLEEIAGLLGTSGEADKLIDTARERLLGDALPENAAILLSMGARGAALIRRDQVIHAVPPQVETINTVGSGDALLAGFLDARARGLDDAESIARAVAVGTASACAEGVGSVSLAVAELFRPQVTSHVTPAVATAFH